MNAAINERLKVSLRALRPLVHAGRFAQPGEIIDVAQDDATALVAQGAAGCGLSVSGPDGGQAADAVASADILRNAIAREAFEWDGRAYQPDEALALPESAVRILFMRGLVIVA